MFLENSNFQWECVSGDSTFLLYRDLFLLLFCSKQTQQKVKLAKYLTLCITEVKMQLRDYMMHSWIPRMKN